MKLEKYLSILMALIPVIVELIKKIEAIFDCDDEPTITN